MKVWAVILTVILLFTGDVYGFDTVGIILLCLVAGAVLVGIAQGIVYFIREHRAESSQSSEE